MSCWQEGGRIKERKERDEWEVFCSCWCQGLGVRRRQTEGGPAKWRAGTCGAPSETCGPSGRGNLIHIRTQLDRWGGIRNHTSVSGMSTYVTHTHTHTLSSVSPRFFCLFYTNRPQKHLKRNSACWQIFRVDDEPPWQVSWLALIYLEQRKEDKGKRLCACCLTLHVLLEHYCISLAASHNRFL